MGIDMELRMNYEKIYDGLTPEQKKIVDDKVLEIWRDNTLRGDMIRAMSYKLLSDIGFKGGDTYEST
jgi:hypothetical protein